MLSRQAVVTRGGLRSELMKYLIDRLSEPSTWRGIISLLTLAGIKFAPEQAESVVTAGISVYSAINIFRKESK